MYSKVGTILGVECVLKVVAELLFANREIIKDEYRQVLPASSHAMNLFDLADFFDRSSLTIGTAGGTAMHYIRVTLVPFIMDKKTKLPMRIMEGKKMTDEIDLRELCKEQNSEWNIFMAACKTKFLQADAPSPVIADPENERDLAKPLWAGFDPETDDSWAKYRREFSATRVAQMYDAVTENVVVGKYVWSRDFDEQISGSEVKIKFKFCNVLEDLIGAAAELFPTDGSVENAQHISLAHITTYFADVNWGLNTDAKRYGGIDRPRDVWTKYEVVMFSSVFFFFRFY